MKHCVFTSPRPSSWYVGEPTSKPRQNSPALSHSLFSNVEEMQHYVLSQGSLACASLHFGDKQTHTHCWANVLDPTLKDLGSLSEGREG